MVINMKKIINFYKNTSKTTKIHLLVLVFFCLIQIIIITRFSYIFGSNVDWMKQHIAFPDYFRNLFYETGTLFPDFAPHLGAGQNIYYFAYYGLYSPIILFSYLLPFVPMNIYIMVTSILNIIISIILFYYFLRKNKFTNNTCFFTSLLFLFSSSFIFHSHRHIMFVNYMPFLILSLIGVWNYFEKKKSLLLIINICLMILTSYYYSVSGIITVCLYGLFYYLKITKEITLKDLIKKAFYFLLRIFLGILLSSFLLLPVIYVIINGRSGNASSFNLDLLIPSINIEFLMYGTYGVGLVSILWISLIYNILFLPKHYRIICIITSIIISLPIFNYLLNGGLYLNGKVFIPFLPLFGFFIASTIKDIKNNKTNWKWLFIAVIGISLILIKMGNRKTFFLIETFTTLYLLYKYHQKQKYRYLIPIVIISIFISTINNIKDDLVTIPDYKTQNNYSNYDIENYLNKDLDSIYRFQDDISKANGINLSYSNNDYRTTLYSSTSNQNYWSSYYTTFNNNDMYRNHFMLAETNNTFFQNYMGIRYLLTNNDAPYGYTPIKEYKNGILYENQNTNSIGFASAHILNEADYNNLSFIEKLLAYQKNVITTSSNSSNEILSNNYKAINLDYTVKIKENIEITSSGKAYQIESKDNGHLLLELNQPIKNKTLVIRFKMNDIPSCKKKDTHITINNIKNTLTCRTWKYYNNNEIFDYVLSSNDEISALDIYFTKGTYDISNIEIYEIPNTFFNKNDITPLIVDNNKIDDHLEGKISISEDSYFVFTIPSDKGFTIKVDNKEIEFEKVNDCFIGFPISNGEHKIELSFKAPYSKSGKIISLFSIAATCSLIIYEKKRSR